VQTITKFDHVLLKFWFTGGISRNISNVIEIAREGNFMAVYTGNATYIINFDNVSMIEEIHQ
jgi:hypothetical protein